jgi:hypothetical protein
MAETSWGLGYGQSRYPVNAGGGSFFYNTFGEVNQYGSLGFA